MISKTRSSLLAALLFGACSASGAVAQTGEATGAVGGPRSDQPTPAEIERRDAAGSVDRQARSGQDDGYEPGDEAGRTIRCPDGSIGKTNAGGCLGDPQPRLTR